MKDSQVMTQTMYEFYESSKLSVRQKCVREWHQWLSEIKNAKKKLELERRLKSSHTADHFSARQELFFHHYFVSKGWGIEWDPLRPKRSPEFLAKEDAQEIFVEARISNPEAQFVQQEEFSRGLKVELEQIPLPHHVYFFADAPTPPLAIFNEVKDQIIEFVRREFERFLDSGASEKDVDWVSVIRGTRYQITCTLYREQIVPQQTLNVRYSLGGSAEIGAKLYEDIEEKTNRYGELGKPYIISVWGRGYSTVTEEKAALYGQQAIQINRDADGNLVGPAESVIQPNGIFFIREDGQLKYRQVSAIVFYQHTLRDEDNEHQLRVYHNPYACHPLDLAVFPAYPQFAPVENDSGNGRMEWIPSEPED